MKKKNSRLFFYFYTRAGKHVCSKMLGAVSCNHIARSLTYYRFLRRRNRVGSVRTESRKKTRSLNSVRQAGSARTEIPSPNFVLSFSSSSDYPFRSRLSPASSCLPPTNMRSRYNRNTNFNANERALFLDKHQKPLDPGDQSLYRASAPPHHHALRGCNASKGHRQTS